MHRRRLQRALASTVAAVIGWSSLVPPGAAATGTAASSVPVIDHYLDAGCMGAPQVVADAAPDASSADVSAYSTPVPESTATASVTPVPLYAPGSGPGQLIVPFTTPTPLVTLPPVPTPTPVPTVSAGPVYLIRATPTPLPTGAASATPASDASAAPTSDASAAPASTASPATPAATSTALAKPGASAAPTSGATATPKPAATLGPNQVAILADDVAGSGKPDVPGDATGNVHVFYRDGVLIGDRAHYDGNRYITVSGHTHLINQTQDTRLDANTIVFDVREDRAVLTKGQGNTTRGVEAGKIYYTADQLKTTSTGVVHGQAANFSTCENPRGGYHMHAKTIDVTPGQKLVARHILVFLGGVAIFYLPFLIIPLSQGGPGTRTPAFIPEFGYDQVDGAYVKARLGFGTSNTYYGYYRIEEYSKRGLGLGYVAFIGRHDGKRQTNIDSYTLAGSNGTGRQDNLNIQDTENWTPHTRGQFGVTYTGDYGPYVSLPASYSLSGTVTHAAQRSSENYTFSRYAVGSEETTINGAIQENRQFSANVTEGLNLSFTQNTNSYAGVSDPSSTFHLNSLTHATTKSVDYDFTIDKTDSQTPSGYDKVPELVIHPHGGHGRIPLDTQLTIGEYTEQSDSRETQRGELDANLGPALFKVFHSSDLSASFGASQYEYGTGDLKAQTRQNINLTTPLGRHFDNVITYTEQNTAGPPAEPFEYLDVLGGAAHNAQEVFRNFNGDIYTLTLSTADGFNQQAQPIAYQFTSRPSPRSSVIIAGSYVPGAGNGFAQTNVQLATPFGRDQTIEFTTNVNWKSRGRLMDKNIYFRKVIGNCYDIRASYNEDLKAVNVTLDLLSFPSHAANFGFSTQQQAIFPQNFIAP